MKKKVFIPGIIVLIIALGVKYYVLTGFNMNFYEGIITNIVTEIASIIITVVIIGSLIKKEEEKEKLNKKKLEKEKYNHLIKDVLGNQLSKLYNELSSTYINFVTKEPLTYGSAGPNIKETNKMIEYIIENIDDYIDEDFRSKEIRAIIADEKPLRVMPSEKVISYQRFCFGVFKAKYQHHLNHFIQRYISVLPEDLRMNIYRMENSINDFVFITILELTGQEKQMPTNEHDQEEIKRSLLIIGNSLNDIFKLINRS